jgi:hypothetical protein
MRVAVKRRRLLWLGAGLVSGAVLAGGVAYAAIPDAGGVIHGCYAKKDGTLRVIDTGAGGSCTATKETSLNWSQTGPQGPPGAAGSGAEFFSGTVPAEAQGVVVRTAGAVDIRVDCSESVAIVRFSNEGSPISPARVLGLGMGEGGITFIADGDHVVSSGLARFSGDVASGGALAGVVAAAHLTFEVSAGAAGCAYWGMSIETS